MNENENEDQDDQTTDNLRININNDNINLSQIINNNQIKPHEEKEIKKFKLKKIVREAITNRSES